MTPGLLGTWEKIFLFTNTTLDKAKICLREITSSYLRKLYEPMLCLDSYNVHVSHAWQDKIQTYGYYKAINTNIYYQQSTLTVGGSITVGVASLLPTSSDSTATYV